MPELRENQAYYDEFASWYERGRDRGYHELIDRLELEAVGPYLEGARVLEAGCGTGLILRRLAERAASASGVDLSGGMLAQARDKRLVVAQATLERLPFPDAAFDLVCSFKVLAHVRAIEAALAELARVTRPGGTMVLEFYNTHSLRHLIKRLRPGLRISEQTTDSEVYTRYDSLAEIRRVLPPRVRIRDLRGVRVVTLVPQPLHLPLVGDAVAALERRATSVPGLRRLGGFLIVIAEKL